MHWTYEPPKPESDLEQGDLLAPTTELRDILQRVHRHFCDDKYLAFIVATQSCDLVRRKGAPKARYISIAAVRSLKVVLPRLLEQVATPLGQGLFTESSKRAAREFLERVLDQNEQSLGLFYLHPDADVELGEAAVAFLRVKVALREEHYDVLVRARRARLDPEFRGKFGWLLGNLYSRAASPDWADYDGGDERRKMEINKLLTEQLPGAGPIWIDDDLVESAREAEVRFEGRPQAEILADLETHRPPPRIEQAADIAVKEVERFLAPNEHMIKATRRKLEEQATAALHALSVSPDQAEAIQKLVADVIDSALQETNKDPAEQLRKYRNKLTNSGALKKLLR